MLTSITTWDMYVWVRENLEKYVSQVECALITFLRHNWFWWSITQHKKCLIYWMSVLRLKVTAYFNYNQRYVCLSEGKGWGNVSLVECALITVLRLNRFEWPKILERSLIYRVFWDLNEHCRAINVWDIAAQLHNLFFPKFF